MVNIIWNTITDTNNLSYNVLARIWNLVTDQWQNDTNTWEA